MSSFLPKSPRSQHYAIAADVQYQLCKTYMKNVCDELMHKETQLMLETSLLLETLPETLKSSATRCQAQACNKDLSTTLQSQNFDCLLNDEDDSTSIKVSKFTRKMTNHSMGTRTLNKSNVEGPLSRFMLDIRENCSRKTVTAVNSLVEQNKLLKKNMAQIQSRNTQSRRTGLDDAKHSYEQVIKLTAHAAKQQKENGYLEAKLAEMGKKLKKHSEERDSSSSSISLSPLNSHEAPKGQQIDLKLLKQIQKFVQERERLTQEAENRMREQQQSIEQSIQKELIESGCERCCRVMKKVKNSLMGYRKCLEDHILQNERLYQCAKQKLPIS